MASPYTQDLLDRATAYAGQSLTQRRQDEGLTELTSLYTAITGQPVGKCRQCQYSDYVAVVQAYIRQAIRFLHPETMAESKYSIAPGLENETFVHEGLSEAITAENLTDQSAEFLIKHGFGHAFVKKGAAAASKDGEPAGDAGKDGEPKTSAAETKAKADLTAEKAAHKTIKDALKAEKEGHAATSKELRAVASKLTDVEKSLTEAQQTIEQLRTPAAEADAHA